MAELVRYIARSLVEKPDAVDVREVETADSVVIELRVDAALTTVRMAFAMRPCLPMTLPMSSSATLSSRMTASGPSVSRTTT